MMAPWEKGLCSGYVQMAAPASRGEGMARIQVLVPSWVYGRKLKQFSQHFRDEKTKAQSRERWPRFQTQ
jgi:hypothetical protein